MKTNLLLIGSLLVIALTTGCAAVDRFVSRHGTPVSTNTVPQVTLHTFTNVVTVTNTVAGVPTVTTEHQVAAVPVTNYVSVTNYAPGPALRDSVEAVRTIGELTGVPGAGTVAATLAAAIAGLFGYSNRRRLREAQQQVNVSDDIHAVLVDNVEQMKLLALQYAKLAGNNDPAFVDKVNAAANTMLATTQQAAGLEELIRDLVAEHTGHTRAAAGLTEVPVPKP